MPIAEPGTFQQLRLLFTDPIQHDYEVIRDVVLFGERITQRSTETGLDRTTVADKARRFLQQGMFGLVDARTTTAGRKPHPFPEHIAGYMLFLKQLYPPIHDREIVRILQRKFGCRTNHHTVKRFLERHPLPVQLPLPWTTFHQFEDAYQARWTVVRLYYEGWHQHSIAGVLKLSRKHVWEIIAAFKRDEFVGLEDQRARPGAHPTMQLTLPFLKDVLQVQQEYPRAGRFRVRGLLGQRMEGEPPSEATVGRAMALNRAHHGAPGPWVTDNVPATQEDEALGRSLTRPRIAIGTGLLTRAIWCAWATLIGGSTACASSRAIRARSWRAWSPTTRTPSPSCNSSPPPWPSMAGLRVSSQTTGRRSFPPCTKGYWRTWRSRSATSRRVSPGRT